MIMTFREMVAASLRSNGLTEVEVQQLLELADKLTLLVCGSDADNLINKEMQLPPGTSEADQIQKTADLCKKLQQQSPDNAFQVLLQQQQILRRMNSNN